MKLDSIIICDKVTENEVNKKLTLHELFEVIESKGFPAVHDKFSIFTHITAKPGNYTQTIEILPPSSNNPIAKSRVEMIINPDQTGANHLANFENTIFPEAGIYKVIVKDKEKEIGEKLLYLKKING